jgi:hypothetical protein
MVWGIYHPVGLGPSYNMLPPLSPADTEHHYLTDADQKLSIFGHQTALVVTHQIGSGGGLAWTQPGVSPMDSLRFVQLERF